MSECKYLKTHGSNNWADCTLRKKRCSYQRYCTTSGHFVTDNCVKCPAFKPDDKNSGKQKK